MFSYDIMQSYTLVRPINQGLKYPRIWCEKSEHSHECGTPNLYHYMHRLRIMSWVNSWVCPAPMFWYLMFRYIG